MAETEHPAVMLLKNAYEHLRDGYEHRETPTVTVARLLAHFAQMPDEFNEQIKGENIDSTEHVAMLQIQVAALSSISAISANYLNLLERDQSVAESLKQLHAFIARGIEDVQRIQKLIRAPASGGVN